MGNLSLKGKLIGMNAVLAMIILIVGGIGFYGLNSVANDYLHVTSINMRNAATLSNMRFYSSEVTRHYLRLFIPGITTETAADSKKKVEENIALVEKFDKEYQAVPFVEGEQAVYDLENAKWLAFLTLAREFVSLHGSSKKDEIQRALTIISKEIPKAKMEHMEALESLILFQDKESAKWISKAQSTEHQSQIISASVVVFGFVLSLVFGYLFSRSLSNKMSDVSSRLSEASEQVRSASQQLSSSGQQLSSGVTEAASSLAETVASVEELSSMVKLNADHAREAAALSQSSKASAEEGEAEIKKLITSMSDISKSSKQIEEIIGVIDDIAFQTNLLALNAAVEAARAGEQGKGFAVVAEAVRTLAQRSASAAKDISNLIKDSVGKVESGSRIADQSGVVLKNIVLTVKKVADLNIEISSASQEQSNGLSQISKAMNELDQSTQGNASASEEIAASAEEMSSQATNLSSVVGDVTKIVHGKYREPVVEGGVYRQPNPTRSTGRQKMHTSRPNSNVIRISKSPAKSAEQQIPFDSGATLGKVGTTEGF